MSWEVHISVAPRPAFFRRVRLLAASLRRFGGLDPVRIVGLVQRECEPYNLAAALPWSAAEGIEWRWIDPHLLAAHGPHVVSLERFLGPFEASHVLMLDADTLCVGALDELAELAAGAFTGVVAFQSPLLGTGLRFRGEPPAPERFWAVLHAEAGLGPPALTCEHPLWGIVDDDPAQRFCPPYFNNGVMAGPADVVARIGEVIFESLTAVDRVVDSYYRSQLATTLATARSGVPWRALPLRFNFVNSPALWTRLPAEAARARIVHFLYLDEVDRDCDFADDAALAAFLNRTDLSPVNALLQERIAALVPDLAGAGAVG